MEQKSTRTMNSWSQLMILNFEFLKENLNFMKPACSDNQLLFVDPARKNQRRCSCKNLR